MMKYLVLIMTFISTLNLSSCATGSRSIASDMCDQAVKNNDHDNHFQNAKKCKGY